MAEAKNAEAIRIGRLIGTLRRNKDWSQQDLSHESGVSISTLSRWERGLHEGDPANRRKVAAALEVDPLLLKPAEDVVLGSQLDRIEQKLDRLLGALDEHAPGVGSDNGTEPS